MYREPLTPQERHEYEEDLISFSDHQLDLLGDIRGLNVLYAGGSSLLWAEGLSQRLGHKGSLTVLDIDDEAIERTRERASEANFDAPVNFVVGDVLAPPFEGESFNLAYSAGLFHELDVTEKPAENALGSLISAVRRGGRVSTTDFVDSVSATQIEDERLQGEILYELFGHKPYGVGPPERLVTLHKKLLKDVSRRVLPPRPVRHLGKVVLAEEEPEGLLLLPPEAQNGLRGKRGTFRERIRREGYTRPATLYVEGRVPGN